MAASIAEALSLLFYYPYDLIKTRMQTAHGNTGYHNLIDGFIKIYKANLTKHELLTSTSMYKFRQVFTRLRRFYYGMPLFGLLMIAFTALEFSFYEVFLLAIE